MTHRHLEHAAVSTAQAGTRDSKRRRSIHGRRGVIIIGVMVVITIAMMMLVSWLRTTGVERRQVAKLQHRAQAAWLAESGVERAAARLAASADYAGETWKPELTKSERASTAQVVIRVTAVAGHPDRKLVSAQATLGSDPLTLTQRTKETTVQLPSGGD